VAQFEPPSPPASAVPGDVIAPAVSALFAIQIVALWILSAASIQLLLVIVASLPPRANEPWLLRWLRTAGEHPVRSTLALGLGLHALVLSRPLGRP
jgi:hypothetical protein